MGLIQRLENRVVGKAPKQPKGKGKPAADEFDEPEFDPADYPDGTVFDGQGRPVFVPASAGELFWKRLTGSGWVSKQEWEADMSRRCGRKVTWEESVGAAGGGTQVG